MGGDRSPPSGRLRQPKERAEALGFFGREERDGNARARGEARHGQQAGGFVLDDDKQRPGGEQRDGDTGEFSPGANAPPEPAQDEDDAHAGAEQQRRPPRVCDRGEPRHHEHRDQEDEQGGSACDPHQRARVGIPAQPGLADQALINVVRPVRRAPVQVGVDRRRQRRQHGGQHQALNAPGEQLDDPLDKGDFPLVFEDIGSQGQIGRKEQQEPQGDRQPEKAAQQYLGDRKDDARQLGVPVGLAGHRPLGQVAGAVGIELDQPLQAEQGQKRE